MTSSRLIRTQESGRLTGEPFGLFALRAAGAITPTATRAFAFGAGFRAFDAFGGAFWGAFGTRAAIVSFRTLRALGAAIIGFLARFARGPILVAVLIAIAAAFVAAVARPIVVPAFRTGAAFLTGAFGAIAAIFAAISVGAEAIAPAAPIAVVVIIVVVVVAVVAATLAIAIIAAFALLTLGPFAAFVFGAAFAGFVFRAAFVFAAFALEPLIVAVIVGVTAEAFLLLRLLRLQMRRLGGAQHAKIVFGVLEIILRLNTITGGVRIARELEIFLVDHRRGAADLDVRPIGFHRSVRLMAARLSPSASLALHQFDPP